MTGAATPLGSSYLLVAAASLAGCPRPLIDPPAHREPELVGVTHVVRTGETLWRIAQAYGIDASELALVNAIADPSKLAAGTGVFVPGATAVVEVDPARGIESLPGAIRVQAGRFLWPLSGVLYARFGKRGDELHDGIDLAAPEGTPVACAGEGKVIFAGEQRGYGRIVIVDHGEGLVTIYAHNQENRVAAGQAVKARQTIATVGKSGQTTGPHLHFEVREGGRAKDPLLFLPRPR